MELIFAMLNIKKPIQIIAGCVFVTLISGCAGGIGGMFKKNEVNVVPVAKPLVVTPPGWVLGREHPKYPLSQYIVGVGSSDEGLTKAKESSRLDLAKSIKVKIKSRMEDYSSTERTSIQSLIITEVNTILEGVEFKDGWYDNSKKAYHSFAALNRTLAASGIKSRIKETESLLEKHLRQGNEAEEKGDVVRALFNYLNGYHKTTGLPSLRSSLRVITHETQPEQPWGVQDISKNTFLGKINGITQNLRLNVISGDNQVVKTYKGISKPLVAEVYLDKSGRKIPLSNIPVLFRFEKGEGQLESERVSDTNGRVQSTIHKIDNFDRKHHVIGAKLNYEIFASNFEPSSKNLLSALNHVKVVFNHTIDTPKWASNKSQAWKSGITDLVNQVVQNIPPGGNPLVGVTGFRDLRHDKIAKFNEVLKEDFETVLVQAQSLIVKSIVKPEEKTHEETAKEENLTFYVHGSYRLEKKGIEIRAKLIETQSQHILSFGNILIDRSEINSEDLAFLTSHEKQLASPGETYDANVETFFVSKPEVPAFNLTVVPGFYKNTQAGKVWTTKNEYQIGENIVFRVESDVDAFLTLWDIHSNGDTTLLFPNDYDKKNLIRAGVTRDIPATKFKFDVQGPAGLERIKAIATLSGKMPLDFDYSHQKFFSIKPTSSRGARDIEVLANEFSTNKSSDWAEASSKIHIFERGKVYYRGSRNLSVDFKNGKTYYRSMSRDPDTFKNGKTYYRTMSIDLDCKKVPIVKKPGKPKDMKGTLGKDPKGEKC